MEGWKLSVLIAFLLAVTAAEVTNPKKCSDFKCPKNVIEWNMFPDPQDHCKFCCCQGEPNAESQPCPYGEQFDNYTQSCVPSDDCPRCQSSKCPACYQHMDCPIPDPDNDCDYCLCEKDGSMSHHKCPCGYRYNEETLSCDIHDPDLCPCPVLKHCQGVVCPGDLAAGEEKRFPDVKSKCDFCCCLGKSNITRVRKCPGGEWYDPSLDDCVPDTTGQCGGHNGHHTEGPPHGSGEGCSGVKCPTNPEGTPLYPAGDPQYFCQCDWGGMVHQMPCAGGTRFSFKYQACV